MNYKNVEKMNRNRLLRNRIIRDICIVLFTILLCNCSDRDIVVSVESDKTTRGIVSSNDYISNTNPNLINNWENQETILLSTGNSVTTPWCSGAAITSNVEFAMDIKKEDGWKMLFHTFKSLHNNLGSNYMFFYNRLTGYLKVFYYREADNIGNNGGMWQLKTMNGETSTLFNLNEYLALPDNASTANSSVTISNITQGPVTGFTHGWNGFELELPYSTDYKDVYFALVTYNKNIMTYNFMGNVETNIEGTLTKFGSSTSGLINAISWLGGQGAKHLVDKLKKKVDNNQANDTTGNVKAKLGTKIVNLLSNVSAKDYTSLISKGLKFIFGSTTTIDKTYVKLTANSKITLSGTSENPSFSDITTLGLLNLYDIMNGSVSRSNLNFLENQIVIPNSLNDNFNEEFLGVWTLKKAPVLTIFRYGFVRGGRKSGRGYLQNAQVSPPVLFNTDFFVEVNPYLSQYITSKSFKIEIMTCIKKEGKPYRPIEDHNYPADNIETDMIYEDDDMLLREKVISTDKTFILPYCKVPMDNKTYEYYFDWGEVPTGQELVVVTGEISYNYNNKNHNITFSRVYKPEFIYDAKYDYPIMNNPNAYIIHKPIPGED